MAKKQFNILVIGGTHGDEITPLFMLATRGEELKRQFKNLTIINGANLSAMKSCARTFQESPPPNGDLNRAFASEAAETWNDLVTRTRTAVDHADFVIDLHCSPNSDTFMLVSIDKYAASFSKLAAQAGIKCAFRANAFPSIKNYCTAKGVPAITIECNGMRTYDAIAAAKLRDTLASILNLAPQFKMTPDPQSAFCELAQINAPATGLFLPSVHPTNNLLPKGRTVGNIIGLDGRQLAKVIMPQDGIPLTMTDRGFVETADNLMLYQPA